MIYFDNAATTYPKPQRVRHAAAYAMAACGNAGRGGHVLAERTSRMVYAVRESVADFFDAKPENTILCLNCTHALNTAIRGVLKAGDHVVISSLEHNAVYRPVYAMVQEGQITCTIAHVDAEDAVTLEHVVRAVTPQTKAVIFTMASNVTGQITPIREIGAFCQAHGICLIADGAQKCGVLPVSLKEDHISILCTAGHKGLYGITGTGLLMTDCAYPIKPLLYGGTGSASRSPNQPDFLPDRLESGTQNIIGAVSMGAGIAFLQEKTLPAILSHEQRLCQQLLHGLSEMPEIIVYRTPDVAYVPIVSFNVRGVPSEVVADALRQEGLCLRAGLHCAPLAHQTLGTDATGTVRFAPSVFNTPQEVTKLLLCLHKCVRNLKTT